MSEQPYHKQTIGLMQIETALKLYFEGQDYFSAITLAGAAEEIFGKLLSTRGIENSLESITAASTAIHQKLFGSPVARKDIADRANRARNALKHVELNESQMVSLDPKEEAKDMLQRAVDNYWLLEQSLTPAMERFQREAMAA